MDQTNWRQDPDRVATMIRLGAEIQWWTCDCGAHWLEDHCGPECVHAHRQYPDWDLCNWPPEMLKYWDIWNWRARTLPVDYPEPPGGKEHQTMTKKGNHVVDLMDFSIDLELVKKIVFDDRLGQATIHFWRESPPPIITRSPLDRARLWSLCSADVCGLRSKAFDHNGISFDEIHRGRSVSVEAKPAPAPERINLWNAVNDALYDFPKDNGVECADRVIGALERDKPTILCVGNVLYFRQDKAIQDAKELRERAATLISSLRSVVDECMERIHRPKVRKAKVSGLAKKTPAKKTPAKKGGRRR